MATRKSSSRKRAKPAGVTERLNLAVEMAHKIDAIFHYFASQQHVATNADDCDDDEDWNYGGDTSEQRDPHEPMRRAALMRGLELTTALMDLATDRNMDECRTVA